MIVTSEQLKRILPAVEKDDEGIILHDIYAKCCSARAVELAGGHYYCTECRKERKNLSHYAVHFPNQEDFIKLFRTDRQAILDNGYLVAYSFSPVKVDFEAKIV